MKGLLYSVEILKTKVGLTPDEKSTLMKTIEETGRPKDERPQNTDYEDTLFEYTPEFNKIVETAIQLVKDETGLDDMKLDDWEYWAHIHEKNMSTDIHSHHPDSISVVYYLNVPEGSGNIVFLPEPIFIPTSMVESVEDEILVFPGWLKHKVTRHNSDEKRISVSFNLYPKEIWEWRMAGRTAIPQERRPEGIRSLNKEEPQDEA